MSRRHFLVSAIPVLAVLLWYVARTPGVEDWRHGNGVSEVHGIQMRTEEVHDLAGHISFLPEYMDAASQFPDAGWYRVQRGTVFQPSRKIHVCSERESARQSWMEQNP